MPSADSMRASFESFRVDRAMSGSGDDVPLRQNSSPEHNRRVVDEHRRQLTTEILLYSLPLMLCGALVVLFLGGLGILIYIRGWIVWFSDRDKPCDQPLKWWLLAMLLAPILQWWLDTLLQQCQKTLVFLKALVIPAVILVGFWLVYQCETCQVTNKRLYGYAKMYLMYQSVIWVVMMFTSFGLVSAVVWLNRHGLLQGGPGPARAARVGLINELETVEFSENLFEGMTDSDGQLPECSICSEPFSADLEIKKTPCGHLFHKECLGNWLGNYGRSCPLCRENVEELMDGQEISVTSPSP
mmetsp:Transcript_36999/g.85391  ORF Transcript_36999/g.85391 Transcript_36999/m.85391 type:complete len:299 (+) Transcript_36999:178-1074(+)